MRMNDMTAQEAEFFIARMKRETLPHQRVANMQTALRIGQLSDEAKAIYRAALADEADEAQ